MEFVRLSLVQDVFIACYCLTRNYIASLVPSQTLIPFIVYINKSIYFFTPARSCLFPSNASQYALTELCFMSIYSLEFAAKLFSNLLTVVTRVILLAFIGLFSHLLLSWFDILLLFVKGVIWITHLYTLYFSWRKEQTIFAIGGN
jgi:hypothetical protein